MRYLIHHRDFQILLIIDSPLVFFSNQVFSMLSHRTYLLLFSHLKEVENCFISATNEKPVADANCTTESGGISRDLSLCVSRDNVHYVEPMKQCMVVICSVISAIFLFTMLFLCHYAWIGGKCADERKNRQNSHQFWWNILDNTFFKSIKFSLGDEDRNLETSEQNRICHCFPPVHGDVFGYPDSPTTSSKDKGCSVL